MVKVGFICEGKTEKKIIESVIFQEWLIKNDIQCINPVFDAEGNGNLLPNNIRLIREELIKNGAQQIIILTDLDDDVCITLTKQRITHLDNQIVLIAVKKIEAWFLADHKTISQLVNSHVIVDLPEASDNPFETIQQLFLEKTGRGIGTQPMLARRMIKYGFSVEKAAQHPNCPSANYFLTKLQSLRP